MARVPFSDVEAWMEANDLRPAAAARALGVSSQRFNGWKQRGQVSADASDSVRRVMGATPDPVAPDETPAHTHTTGTETLAALAKMLTETPEELRPAVGKLLESLAMTPDNDKVKESLAAVLKSGEDP